MNTFLWSYKNTLTKHRETTMDNQQVFLNTPFFIPVPMTQEKFAEQVGLTTQAVRTQVCRGYLPTIKIGKRRLIDTVTLAARCLEKNHNTGNDE